MGLAIRNDDGDLMEWRVVMNIDGSTRQGGGGVAGALVRGVLGSLFE